MQKLWWDAGDERMQEHLRDAGGCGGCGRRWGMWSEVRDAEHAGAYSRHRDEEYRGDWEDAEGVEGRSSAWADCARGLLGTLCPSTSLPT